MKWSATAAVRSLSIGRGWGEKFRSFSRITALRRIALDDAEPVIGRAFARPVGIARTDPTSSHWGEVKEPT